MRIGKKNKIARTRGKTVDVKARAEITFPYIPECITLEILSRLPIKSLLRFSCISKRWHSLVSSITTPKIKKSKILVTSYSKLDFLTFHSIDENGDVKRVCEPWKKRASRYYLNFLGSCNGLLLLQIEYDLFLWNPLTSFFKKVLSCNVLPKYEYEFTFGGLFYDPSTDEYKAVLALSKKVVVVVSFKSHSWSKIDFPYIVSTVNSGPVMNGYIHWYTSGYNSSHQIIYFNSQICEFEKVPMPPPKHHSGDYLLGLGALDGCLCMTRSENPRTLEGDIEVLVMKEYGVEISWTILFTISNLNNWVYDDLLLYGYMKNGEAILKVYDGVISLSPISNHLDYNSRIRTFNPDDNTHREILIQPEYYHAKVIFYEESLVTPTGYKFRQSARGGK
ncbi:F-box/kelch-repeat protein At3g23880-like [Actinidia eriantha]|uniref:F-box/kelch-repeat protein At3g23880-like n=1 Tax=Actinidia eriantha TaxID=165200 RepID=UPI00258C748B|nr:F-box/kelch-repeat protein At3g23880-like [Actinidia eriantha]